MIAAEREHFNSKIHDENNRLSEEETKRLMSEHTANLDMLSRNINMEKDRQLNALANKIAERRKMQVAILAKKHEAEVSKELVTQKVERNEVEDNHVRS